MVPIYEGKQMRIRCGANCLIALVVASSDQETGASKQLAPQLLTDTGLALCQTEFSVQSMSDDMNFPPFGANYATNNKAGRLVS